MTTNGSHPGMTLLGVSHHRSSIELMTLDKTERNERRVVGPGFHKRVYELVRTVPCGRVATYGDVAAALGSARVARHVGFALAALRSSTEKDAVRVPWYRIINTRGAISFPPGSASHERQRQLLEAEGVTVSDSGKVNLRRLRYTFS